MADSKVIDSKPFKGGRLDLIELGDGWSPWTHQIARVVDDGKAYQSPGRAVCTSRSNYETRDEACDVFNKTKAG